MDQSSDTVFQAYTNTDVFDTEAAGSQHDIKLTLQINFIRHFASKLIVLITSFFCLLSSLFSVHSPSPPPACVSGFFKVAQGDHRCLQCPINSRTTNEGATNCVCRNGYYRSDSDPPQMPCTSMYTPAVNVMQIVRLKIPIHLCSLQITKHWAV